MLPKITSLESYLNIVSSYRIFVTCINTFLVKFKVIHQQVFARNTRLIPSQTTLMGQLSATYRTRNSNLIHA